MPVSKSWKSRLHAVVRWFGGREPATMIAVVAIVAGVWGFIELADEVTDTDPVVMDQWIIDALRFGTRTDETFGPAWFPEAIRDLTALGSVTVLIPFTLVIAGYVYFAGEPRTSAFVLISTWTGLLASDLLKRVFARPRPPAELRMAEVYTSSFPSGHSMLSAVVFLTLGVLLAGVAKSRRLQIYSLTVAVLLTLTVGLTRIYLAVHYPTDVLAGWTAGAVWALCCWLVLRALQKHGDVEPPRLVQD